MLDLTVALLASWLALRGFRSGLTGALVWVGVAVLTSYLAGLIAPGLSSWIEDHIPVLPAFVRQPSVYLLALIAVGAVTRIGSSFVMRRIRGFEQGLPVLYKTDRVTGALGSAAAGLLAVGFITLMAAPMLNAPSRARLANTYWGGAVVPRMAPVLPDPAGVLEGLLERTAGRLGRPLPIAKPSTTHDRI